MSELVRSVKAHVKAITASDKNKTHHHTAVESAKACIESAKSKLQALTRSLQHDSTTLHTTLASLTPSIKALTIDDENVVNPWVVRDQCGEGEEEVVRFLEVECVDREIEVQRREEYESLKNWYQTKTQSLQSTFSDVLSTSFGGWSADNHRRFEKILDEYAAESHGRWGLIVERVALELGIGSAEVAAHHDWTLRHTTYKSIHQTLTRAFLSKLSECISTTLSTFREAAVMHARHTQRVSDMSQQVVRMEADHAKLKAWREAKVQALVMEERRRMREVEEKVRRETEMHERALRRRTAEKKQIAQYHSTKEAQLQHQHDIAQQLQEAHELELAERDKHAQSRLMYRHEQHVAKLESRKQQAEEAQRQKEEVEKRLEKLRESVAVHVDSDWERILKDTEATTNSKNAVIEPAAPPPDSKVVYNGPLTRPLVYLKRVSATTFALSIFATPLLSLVEIAHPVAVAVTFTAALLTSGLSTALVQYCVNPYVTRIHIPPSTTSTPAKNVTLETITFLGNSHYTTLPPAALVPSTGRHFATWRVKPTADESQIVDMEGRLRFKRRFFYVHPYLDQGMSKEMEEIVAEVNAQGRAEGVEVAAVQGKQDEAKLAKDWDARIKGLRKETEK
ncbi:hypothetical protein HK104_004138 [Borealophlyctis nickersoniae]|nr:hypothetical protein HK104_004138 [Borealophlyctis nickersoniae]